MASSGGTNAKRLADSAGLEAVARAGLVAYGVVYLLIGGLALQLAWGAGPSKSPDPSGAFRTLAEQPLGNVLLWLIALSLVALGLWKASDVFWGHRNFDGAERVRRRVHSGVWAVIYSGLGIRSALVAAGFGSGSSNSPQQATVGVLAWPGGRAIVIATGLIIISVGLVEAIRGVRKSFSEEIDTSSLSSAAQMGVLHLGQVGYVTKGMALGMVGGSAQLCGVDLRLAEGVGAGRSVADGPCAAFRKVAAQHDGRWIRGLRFVCDAAVPVSPDVKV